MLIKNYTTLEQEPTTLEQNTGTISIAVEDEKEPIVKEHVDLNTSKHHKKLLRESQP